MRPFRLSCFALLCAALLAACATPGSVPPRGKPVAQRPAIDWPAVRAGLQVDIARLDGITMQAQPDGTLLLRIPAADGFALNQTEPRPALTDTLEKLIPVLQAHAQAAIEVIGHTDSIGSELHNLHLSIARAEAVAEFLRSRGIALLRLSADGRGEAEPLADNGTPAGQAANRRVELILRPLY
jgi:outer membrane protein OmpA-like peptidoglycan-associated protein